MLHSSLAEREGFEPPEPLSSTVFKTAAIDHSAIFPGAKVAPYFHFTKFPTGIRRSVSPGGSMRAARQNGRFFPMKRRREGRSPRSIADGRIRAAEKMPKSLVFEIFINFVRYG